MSTKPVLASTDLQKLGEECIRQNAKYQVMFCAVEAKDGKDVRMVWVAIPYPVSRYTLAAAYAAVAHGSYGNGMVCEVVLGHSETREIRAPSV